MANVYESIEKSMLPVEYLPDDYEGPNAGTVDQIVGAYFSAYIWASTRQNLSSGFPTKQASNQPAKLHKIHGLLKICL